MSTVIRASLKLFSVRSISTSTRFARVRSFDNIEIATQNIDLNNPRLFSGLFRDVPAIARWFINSETVPGAHELRSSYLDKYGSAFVPLELTRSAVNDPDAKQNSSFERFDAPLSLLLSQMTSSDKTLALYLAQCPLYDLPSDLQADLPTPDLIARIGRGDIYASSLWMGRPPTKTPLHRDPNPNLFVQLAGRKVVRLMKPEYGRRLYERLGTGRGHANIRGEEMMAGGEMERLESAIWDDDNTRDSNIDGLEAVLESGDALFVPLGWWHAVHGVGSGANASVNWWFR